MLIHWLTHEKLNILLCHVDTNDIITPIIPYIDIIIFVISILRSFSINLLSIRQKIRSPVFLPVTLNDKRLKYYLITC